MAVLKALTSGGKRRELDFYPTPPEATRALLPLIEDWPQDVWEPCCGDGAISKVLIAHGKTVISSDLVSRGYGIGEADFFKIHRPPLYAIITNPPFGRADDFIRHAFEIGVEKMALLLKVNFWNAHTYRRKTWHTWRPYLIAPLTWRLDFTGAGRPHTDCAWNLWDRSIVTQVTGFEPIHRP